MLTLAAVVLQRLVGRLGSSTAAVFCVHIAHENVTLVSLVSSPASQAVGLHRVAANFAIHLALFPVLEELGQVDKRVELVHGVRHGRARMGIRNVVATIVITTVHRVVHVLRYTVTGRFVLWLIDRTKSFVVADFQRLYAWDLGKDFLRHVLARAVGAYVEVLLDFVADDRPLGRVYRSLVARVVMVNEELVRISSLALREHGVHNEDGRHELLPGVINRLHVVATGVQRPNLGRLRKDWVLDGLLSITHFDRDEFISLQMIRHFDWTHLAFSVWVCKVGDLTIQIAIDVRGLTVGIDVIVTMLGRSRRV